MPPLKTNTEIVISKASFVRGLTVFLCRFSDLLITPDALCNTCPFEVFLKNLLSDDSANHAADKTGNQKKRKCICTDIPHNRIGIFLTIAGNQILVIAVPCYNNRNIITNNPHRENPMRNDPFLCALIIAGLQD